MRVTKHCPTKFLSMHSLLPNGDKQSYIYTCMRWSNVIQKYIGETRIQREEPRHRRHGELDDTANTNREKAKQDVCTVKDVACQIRRIYIQV